ncbi:MAG: saccharopine dehydrogenase NADP-binding domain-containing protein [Firmicutes bacterium]|nr:saccharopine dehydrogenase NADP-binding domain-containing protein [Bacillota bacterium]
MKKILVLGVGAQGSAAAKRLDKEPNVKEIICADYDMKAVESVVASITKGRGMFVDAHDRQSIIDAAQGVDLILNGLPLECTENVLEAALAVKANYQDYAGTTELYDMWFESDLAKVPEENPPHFGDKYTTQWYYSVKAMYEIYGPKFEAIDRLALFGTGSAPGLICAATRKSMEYLDTCETIYNIVWEGVYAKRFLPFWWSPITALTDMSEMALAYENGMFISTPAFGLPMQRQYEYMDEPVTFYEHCHDEPLQYGMNAEKYFKGCKNAYFKYAGAGMDFAKSFYQTGMLSHDPVIYDGKEIVPFDFVLSFVPPAPKYKEEIQEIIDEGLVSDSGCMVIEAYGKKDGKDVLVETHVFAPGLVESFEKAGITAEMYLTGQGGYLFSKLFVNDQLDQKGVISSDMLTFEQVDTYFKYAAELDITLETKIKEL